MGMTNKEETLDWLYRLRSEIYVYMPKEWLIPMNNALDIAIKALEQEPTTKNDLGVDKFDKAINQSDLEEWIMETFPDWCEGDVRLIMNHMDEMPSLTPDNCGNYIIQEPFMATPCISSKVCEHDRMVTLDKIRAEIIARDRNVKAVRSDGCCFFTAEEVLQILDKYKAESETQKRSE